MKNQFYLLLAILALITFACQKTDNPQFSIGTDSIPVDYSGAFVNKELSLEVTPERSIIAYLSKPEGEIMDIVLCLHGGTKDLAESHQATFEMAMQENGGRQFLEDGKAVLTIAYTEYEDDESIATRGFKEMEEVLAAVDFLKDNPFVVNQLTLQRIFAFGSSRGGGLALLAGIERALDGVVSAEGPLDWMATHDSIASGFLEGSELEEQNFEIATEAWGDPHIAPTFWIQYSPGLRVLEFKSPFLVISGMEDEIIMISTAVQMKSTYLEACELSQCFPGGQFILHPFGHTTWDTPGILQAIQVFTE